MDSYSEGAWGRGPYMWLPFVRNGACAGAEEESGESEVFNRDGVTGGVCVCAFV